MGPLLINIDPTFIQKQSPRNIEFDTKGVPKRSQNRCQRSSKFNAKIGIEKTHLVGCVREQNRYQKNIKNDMEKHTKIDDKSMLNLCSKKRCEQK